MEDSASGVAAALNANMHCLAATSEFTVDGVRKLANMKDEYIVEDPAQLVAVFETILQEISSEESAPNQPET